MVGKNSNATAFALKSRETENQSENLLPVGGRLNDDALDILTVRAVGAHGPMKSSRLPDRCRTRSLPAVPQLPVQPNALQFHQEARLNERPYQFFIPEYGMDSRRCHGS